jgi:hypothetical protein
MARKNCVAFKAYVSQEDARRLRAVANAAGVSVTQVLSRMAEVAVRRSKVGRVVESSALLQTSGFLTLANAWQEEVDGTVAPCGAYVTIDLRQAYSSVSSSR